MCDENIRQRCDSNSGLTVERYVLTTGLNTFMLNTEQRMLPKQEWGTVLYNTELFIRIKYNIRDYIGKFKGTVN
jgi:hypothetical protein